MPRPQAAPAGRRRDRQPAHAPPPAIELRPRARGRLFGRAAAGRAARGPRGRPRVPDRAGRPARQAPACDLSAAITQAAARAMENTEHTAVTLLQTAQSLIGQLSRGDHDLRADAGAVGVHADHDATASSTSRARCTRPAGAASSTSSSGASTAGSPGVVRGQLIICVRQRRAVGHRLLHARPEVLGVPDAGRDGDVDHPDLRRDPEQRPRGAGRAARRTSASRCSCWRGSSASTSSKPTCSTRRSWATRRACTRCSSCSRCSRASTSPACVGALLAVPVLSITQTLFLYLRERFLGVPRSSSLPADRDRATTRSRATAARTPGRRRVARTRRSALSYASSTTTAVMLSRPPRWLASSTARVAASWTRALRAARAISRLVEVAVQAVGAEQEAVARAAPGTSACRPARTRASRPRA